MDPRLLVLTPAEQQAVTLAAQEKKNKQWDDGPEGKGKDHKRSVKDTTEGNKKEETVTLKDEKSQITPSPSVAIENFMKNPKHLDDDDIDNDKGLKASANL
ncbi:hypothetical protein C0J52_17903 [Blattella germanica]|nr:hypothetical protein C0J52_17903 [Blattella germanica]